MDDRVRFQQQQRVRRQQVIRQRAPAAEARQAAARGCLAGCRGFGASASDRACRARRVSQPRASCCRSTRPSGNPNGWAGFLDALSHAYGGSLSCITSYDFANRTGVLDASSGADKEFETSYVTPLRARLNPWMAVLERLPVGLATLSDNILPYADLQRTEFYNDWCRPQRVGGGVGGFVERNGRRVVAATILLSRPIIDQDAAVLSRLEMLMPHLLWVSQLHRQFTTLEARATAAEGGARSAGDGHGHSQRIRPDHLHEREGRAVAGEARRAECPPREAPSRVLHRKRNAATPHSTPPALACLGSGINPGGVMCVSRALRRSTPSNCWRRRSRTRQSGWASAGALRRGLHPRT